MRTQFGWVLVLLIVLGIGFRFVGLGDRVYWVDEVATSIRVAGHTRSEIMTQLTDAPPQTPADLQQFLYLAPQTPWRETLAALAHSPEHAPLYFLLTRLWAQIWGSSVVAMRSLSVLLSLVAIALMGKFAHRLFGSVPTLQSPATATATGMAMALLSISPYFVAYSQEARPYSLWSVTLLWSGLCLLEAMRYPARWRWLGYALSVAVGLYTTLLTAIVVLGQGAYVLSGGDRKRIQGFGLAMLVAGIGFLPWLAVMVQHWGLLEDNTEWMREPMGVFSLLAIWLYSVSVLLFDVPATLSFDLETAAKIFISTLVVGLMAVSTYYFYRSCSHQNYLSQSYLNQDTRHSLKNLNNWQFLNIWRFFLALAFSIPIVLMTLDLIKNSQYSTAARYLLPFQLGMLLAIAFFLSQLLNSRKQKQRSLGYAITVIVLFLCFLSLGFQLQQPPKYQKSRNLHNEVIAALINQSQSPVILAEPDQVVDLLSLSFDLNPNAKIQFSEGVVARLQSRNCDERFLFNPSQELKDKIQQNSTIRIQQIYHPKRLVPNEIALSLWKVEPNCAQ